MGWRQNRNRVLPHDITVYLWEAFGQLSSYVGYRLYINLILVSGPLYFNCIPLGWSRLRGESRGFGLLFLKHNVNPLLVM